MPDTIGGRRILMAHAAVAGEIEKHLELAFALSRREVFLKLILEAENLVRNGQILSAAIVAGLVLEEAVQSSPPRTRPEEDRVHRWREMRNRAANPGADLAPAITLDHIEAMIGDIKVMLEQVGRTFRIGSGPFFPPQDTPARIRGKYRFVNTSAEEFLKRKREDVTLEDRKCP